MPPPPPLTQTTTNLPPSESEGWGASFTLAKVRFTTACWCVSKGFMDSANIPLFVRYFVTNTVIRNLLVNCFAVNFVLFLSLFLISELVGPLRPAGAFAVVIEGLFGGMWIIPMYVVTQMLGVTWYEQLYDETVRERSIRRKRPPPPPRPFSFIGVSEILLKSLVTLLFGLLAGLVALVPIRLGIGFLPIDVAIGPLCSLAMGCWLNSVYCFDYRFNQVGTTHPRTGKLVPISLSLSLKYFERKWAYFLGFSMWHIAVRTAMEYANIFLFGRLAICSALFAVNVVLSVDAKPTLAGDDVLPPLPVFLPFYRIVGTILSGSSSSAKQPAPTDEVVGSNNRQQQQPATAAVTQQSPQASPVSSSPPAKKDNEEKIPKSARQPSSLSKEKEKQPTPTQPKDQQQARVKPSTVAKDRSRSASPLDATQSSDTTNRFIDDEYVMVD